MNAEALFSAMEGLDADMLYEARAESRPEPRTVHRIVASAAVFVLLVSAALIYGLFVRPCGHVYLDSLESVELTLNARGRVLSVMSQGHDRSAQSGCTAAEAIKNILPQMLSDGSLNGDENTLIIGMDGMGYDLADELADAASGVFDEYSFKASVVTVCCDGVDQGPHPSPAMASVADRLSGMSESLAPNSLVGLSANDLNLLYSESELSADDIKVTGEPSDSAHIGFDKAVGRALDLTSFTDDEIGDISVRHSAYHGSLVYLVRLSAGSRGEAYFINAVTGAAVHAVKAPTAQLDDAVAREMNGDVTPPAVTTAPQSTEEPSTRYDSPTQPPTSAASAQPTQRADETPPVSAEISMKELSFVLTAPPDSAGEIAYTALFEGQCFDVRDDERQGGGTVSVITSLSGLSAFLADNDYQYVGAGGDRLDDSFDEEYFRSHSVIAVSCAFTDASYYAKLTALSADGGTLYAEMSIAYGESRSGEYCCRALSLYETDKSSVPSGAELIIY